MASSKTQLKGSSKRVILTTNRVSGSNLALNAAGITKDAQVPHIINESGDYELAKDQTIIIEVVDKNGQPDDKLFSDAPGKNKLRDTGELDVQNEGETSIDIQMKPKGIQIFQADFQKSEESGIEKYTNRERYTQKEIAQ